MHTDLGAALMNPKNPMIEEPAAEAPVDVAHIDLERQASATLHSKLSGAPDDPTLDGRDLVAWGSEEYITYEGVDCTLTVERRGAGERPVTVGWHTVNVNVPAEQWVGQSGTITMSAGQFRHECLVEVQNDRHWNVEAIFQVVLDEPNGAYLGELSSTTVFALNDDDFPNGIGAHKGQMRVICAFVIHLADLFPSQVRWGLLFKTWPAVSFLINAVIMIRVIDVGIGQGDSKAIGFLSILYVCAFGVSFLADRSFRKLKLGGIALRSLRTALVSTLLQLTSEGVEVYNTGKVTSVAGDAVAVAVETTWTSVFTLYEEAVQLLVMLGLSFWLNLSNDTLSNDVKLMLSAVPVAMIIADAAVIVENVRKQSKLTRTYMDQADRWGAKIVEYSSLRHLITTYGRGHLAAEDFCASHKIWNGLNFNAIMHEADSMWLAKSVPAILSAILMYYAGLSAIKGHIEIGAFSVLLSTTNSFGGSLASIFSAVFRTSHGYASIKKIAHLLNSDTRRASALKQSSLRKRRTSVLGPNAIPEDAIVMHNVTYGYPGATDGSGGREAAAIPPITVTIEAEQIVAIGSAGPCGKSTLLRLLARSARPTTGFIQYPERWRVRFVDLSPMLFDDTLMANLRYGENFAHPAAEVWALCAKIGMSDDLLGRGDMPVGDGGIKLALSARIHVSIARTLLSGANLLLLSNALDALGPAAAMVVIDVLDEWVRDRGVMCLASAHRDPSSGAERPRACRKKNTVVLSTKLPAVLARAGSRIHLDERDEERLFDDREEMECL